MKNLKLNEYQVILLTELIVRALKFSIRNRKDSDPLKPYEEELYALLRELQKSK